MTQQPPSGSDRQARSSHRLDDVLDRFDSAWQGGPAPEIAEFLPEAATAAADDEARRELLEELIKIDMEYRWRRNRVNPTVSTAADLPIGGNPADHLLPGMPLLEDYLRRFPEVGPAHRLTVEMVAEEYRVRRRWGDDPAHEQYFARFPQHMPRLAAALARVERETGAPGAGDTTVSPDTDVALALSDMPAPPASSAVRPAVVASSPGALPERIGRYLVRGLLGKGGFGTVYLAYDEDLERQIAIKVPRPDRFRNKLDVQAFFREARLAAQLRHQGLVNVYDVGRDAAGDCFIVMEWIDGHPLNVLLERERVAPQQAARWIAQVAEAVHCAHKIGLVHGDLKPANVLVDRERQPHVADFGLMIAESEQRAQAGQVSGTPAYMAPEQVRGEAHRLDGRTDLWALGVIFYEMLVGRRPFTGKVVDDLFDEILNRDPKPPRQFDDSIPADLEWICLKCLSKQIGERYTTGMDLVVDLQQALYDPTAMTQTARGMRRAIAGTSERPWEARARGSQGSQPLGAMHHRFARVTNLPASTSTFIGRKRELGEVAALVRDEALGLITLIGPGGMGKTRLALQLGEDLLTDLPGGIWFADLREAANAAEIAHAVARALDVALTSGEPAEEVIANILEYRRPLLLILDNFEQAVEYAEATVGFWRQRAPQVRFLVTSRSPLGLAGEREYELGPLPAPSTRANGPRTAANVTEYDSVKLFCDRAKEAHAGFDLAGQEAAVAAICAELEGIPLAVELAAARVKILKPAQIAAKLGQKFQVLQSTRRDLAPRQQTLWGAIDWSYELLNEWEKLAFMQACIFRGGFLLDAAESVIDLSPFPQAPLALDVVQSLRDKSLLTLQETRHETRFGMYVSIRDYGEAKWKMSAGADAQQALWRRFAEHYIAWTSDWDAKIPSPQGGEALDRIHQETENLFAVQDWALSVDQPEIAGRAVLALARTMSARGPSDQRMPRLERSLAALGEGHPALQAELTIAASDACQAVGFSDRAYELADRAVELATGLGRSRLLAEALRQQGEMHRRRGDVEGALACFVESERLARELADPYQIAQALASRGFVVWQRGDAAAALACYAEAEAIVRDLGDLMSGAAIARNRGHVLGQRGDYQDALRCYAEAEAIGRELGDEGTISRAVGNRGIVLADQGDFSGAMECYQKAEALARKRGDKRGIAINVGNRGILLADRGDARAALICYTEAEAINREMQTKYGIAVNVGNRGTALADLGEYEAALQSFAEAEALNRQMGNKFLLAMNLGDRGCALWKQGRLEEARGGLREALSLLEEIGSRRSVEHFCFQVPLSQAEHALGNVEEAHRLAEEAGELALRLGLNERHHKLRIRELLALLRTARGAEL